MKCKLCSTEILQLELVEITEDAAQDGHKMSIGICQNEDCCQIYYDLQPLEKMLNLAAGAATPPPASADMP